MYLNIYMGVFWEVNGVAHKTVATAGILGKERLCYGARFTCILMTIHEHDIDKLCDSGALGPRSTTSVDTRTTTSTRIIAMIDSLAHVSPPTPSNRSPIRSMRHSACDPTK